jgi:hypothetical protein
MKTNPSVPDVSHKSDKRGERPALFTFWKLVVLSAFIFAALWTPVSGQTTTATLEGTVTDANGAVLPGAVIKATGVTLSIDRTATSDSTGFYRISALPAGSYTVTVTGTGFAVSTSTIELTVNRTATYDVRLQVSAAVGAVTVTNDVLPLIEPSSSSTGMTVTPKQIQDFPVNGREYLDLLQLVPGVAINRQSSGDNASPVLGERSGNNNFFIDGQPNKDTVSGGAAAQFNQETISEFQVLTTGYKAEFGQASGAVVNVLTRSGSNNLHGVGSFFLRNDSLDSSNSLTPDVSDTPQLERYDYSLALGGKLIKDKVFFFGSAERITEDRGIDFAYPNLGTSAGAATVLDILKAQESSIDVPQVSREARAFFKLNEVFGRHQLVQEMNYTNEYVRGSGLGLPSTRTSTSGHRLLLGASDTVLLGDQGNPWIVTLRGAYRDEPSWSAPAHPEYTGSTALSLFPAQQICPPTCGLFSTLPTVTFGNPNTPGNLHQKYTSFSTSVNKLTGDHDVKFGWQYLRTKVDGLDSKLLTNQLFASQSRGFDARCGRDPP